VPSYGSGSEDCVAFAEGISEGGTTSEDESITKDIAGFEPGAFLAILELEGDMDEGSALENVVDVASRETLSYRALRSGG
jgi:hypothetical protein